MDVDKTKLINPAGKQTVEKTKVMDLKTFEHAKYLREEIGVVDAQSSWLLKQPKIQPQSHDDYDRLLTLADDILRKYKNKLEAEFNAL